MRVLRDNELSEDKRKSTGTSDKSLSFVPATEAMGRSDLVSAKVFTVLRDLSNPEIQVRQDATLLPRLYGSKPPM
jgi:hypothetical protein